MLIICNGAIKSGSTWLYNILVNIVECEHPPEKYLTGRSGKSPCIKPNNYEAFMEEQDYESRSFISKNHLTDPRFLPLFAEDQHIYVFDIERDPKDVVVSNYYHDQFRNGFKGSFERYYWQRGRYVVEQLSSYHNLWRNSGPRNYISSYEQLHRNFPGEVQNIANVLGVSLSESDIQQLKEKTSIGSLRKEYREDRRYQGEKFFRKGEIGDWENHFDKKMLADVSVIIERGVPPLDYRKILRTVTSRVGLHR